MAPSKIKQYGKVDRPLQFETLLAEISTLFINLPVDQIDNEIENAQRRICEFLDIDRSTLWQVLEEEPGTMLLTHIFQPSGILTPPDRMNMHDFFPWMQQKVMAGETVIVSKMSDLPTEAARDRETFILYGAKAGVYVPLSVGKGPIFGLLTFAAIYKENEWPERVVEGFTLLAQVFSNTLARKKTEMALCESEARLLLTTNAAGAGLWNMELDTSSVWVSEKTRDLFHFSPDEKLSDESFFKVIHPDDRERVNETIQQAIRTGDNFFSEYRIVLPDGRIRWIAARGKRHPGAAGGSDRLLGVSFDITKRQQSEQELEERLMFETLLAEITAIFVNLPADRLDNEVEDTLRRICEVLGLDLVAFWQRSDEVPDLFTLTHMHSTQSDQQASEIEQGHFPWCAQQILAGRVVIVSSLKELPDEAAQDLESCRLLGIKSNLTFPLSVGGGPTVGILGLNTMRFERAWPDALVKRLQLFAQTFASALERKRMDAQLREHLFEIEGLKQRLEQENIYLQEEVKILADHSEILGKSAAIKNIIAQAEQVAQTDSTVFLLGETGTGKELLARAIHSMSLRKDRPLVTINCASLPPSLIENELFGREKGAYTGAMTRMIGRFELADESTLFLDEIGELPFDLQSKLLRVLEEGKLERLGSTKSLNINVRIIAATNRNIEQEVQDGRFRQDLFYRLNVFPILIPPLRDRSEDISLLVRSFVREFEKKLGKQIEKIPQKTMQALNAYQWPGNVRELKNIIERAMILTKDETLFVGLPKKVSLENDASGNLEDVMRKKILAVLKKTNGRIAGRDGAAEILGLKRSTLYSKMKKLGIRRTGS